MRIPKSALLLKEALKHTGRRVIGSDIDDTIASAGVGYFSNLQRVFGNPECLSAHQMWEKYGRNPVPYWNMEQVDAWCIDNIDSESLHFELSPMPDSRDNLRKVTDHIDLGLYLTARHEVLFDATLRWLRHHGYPRASIVLAPNEIPHAKTLDWKARVLEYLYPEVVGIIEDRDTLAEALSPEYQGAIFLLGHSGHTSKAVVPCLTWHDVPVQVQKYLTKENSTANA